MVWAEMVMGQNIHGSKLLWAEMTSDLLSGYSDGPDGFLVRLTLPSPTHRNGQSNRSLQIVGKIKDGGRKQKD